MSSKSGFLGCISLLCGLLGSGSTHAQAASDDALLSKGKRLFMMCSACHDAKPGPSGKIGPTLFGVVGRTAGTAPGAHYSADMKSKSFVWDQAQLDAWLTKPSAVVAGTSMAYIGMPDPNDRKAVIAFLRSLK